MKKWQKITLIGCGGCLSVIIVGVLVLVGGIFCLRHTFEEKQVIEARGTLPDLPKIDVTKSDRFLNDLMLSPFWKVEKEGDGAFIAKARSIGEDWPSDGAGSFLFEFMAKSNQTLPEDGRIHNRYLDGDKTFSAFQITVVFQKPDLAHVTLGESGQKVTIPVYESYEEKIGPNSSSDLAIKLSSQHEVYVILHEQGSDPTRKTTIEKALPAIQELAGLINAPESYRVEQRYAAFFKMLFTSPLKDVGIERFPGNQDRDTFYGYFRTKPGTSYAGVNIKISHPVYCPDEGTRGHSRLRKAEYLGEPYQEGDIVFFLIEDNAVYLGGEYDERFGTFTGKESFEGDLEVLNDQGAGLLMTKGQFKGWQR
jgi:hypothetical protein